jgi:hypothetical protein
MMEILLGLSDSDEELLGSSHQLLLLAHVREPTILVGLAGNTVDALNQGQDACTVGRHGASESQENNANTNCTGRWFKAWKGRLCL